MKNVKHLLKKLSNDKWSESFFSAFSGLRIQQCDRVYISCGGVYRTELKWTLHNRLYIRHCYKQYRAIEELERSEMAIYRLYTHIIWRILYLDSVFYIFFRDLKSLLYEQNKLKWILFFSKCPGESIQYSSMMRLWIFPPIFI